MAIHRFYLPSAKATELSLELPASEAHQLTRVLRLHSGDLIRVFDGKGHEFSASIQTIKRSRVTIRTLENIKSAPEPQVSLTLAHAVLKGRNVDTVIRDATMLGVQLIQPVITKRSHVTDASVELDGVIKRWHKIAVSSAKQSGRAFVPEIKPQLTLNQLLTTTKTDLRIFLVEPTTAIAYSSLETLSNDPVPDSATLVIGPEGGWTTEEIDLASNYGFTMLTLGTRTLRADATPIVAISALQFLWKDL